MAVNPKPTNVVKDRVVQNFQLNGSEFKKSRKCNSPPPKVRLHYHSPLGEDWIFARSAHWEHFNQRIFPSFNYTS